jgi:hypothetical protein
MSSKILVALQHNQLKAAGSIPNGVIGIFHWLTHSSHNVALGSIQL